MRVYTVVLSFGQPGAGALSVIAHRLLRAPEADGAVLIEPSLDAVEQLLTKNRQLLHQSNISILGRPLVDLRRDARQVALTAARDYLAESGETVPDWDGASIVLAGHQPELFHPGVWIKHFALNGLARRHRLTPVNLIIDNDIGKSAAISVPAWDSRIDPRRPTTVLPVDYRATPIPFNQWAGEAPYEEWTVNDEDVFSQFADRVCAALEGWGWEPLMASYWRLVGRHVGRTRLFGERVAAGRRALETTWGCHNLELPISRLAESEPFTWFTWHLLTELPRFHAIHNRCLHAYRRRHGLRSRSHPVPDLAADGDWLETPFWAWRSGDTHRGRLLARPAGKAVELRVGKDSLGVHDSALITTPYKIRPRALTNTLFARLMLGDLFIHGIGGARYDELTDDIMREFYCLEPPAFVVVSGTLRLPFPKLAMSRAACNQLARELRDLHWNPQRHLPTDADSSLARLAREKQVWIERPAGSPSERRDRFHELRALTAALRPSVAPARHDTDQALKSCEARLDAYAVLSRRDYAFCLFPEPVIREFCTRMF